VFRYLPCLGLYWSWVLLSYPYVLFSKVYDVFAGVVGGGKRRVGRLSRKFDKSRGVVYACCEACYLVGAPYYIRFSFKKGRTG